MSEALLSRLRTTTINNVREFRELTEQKSEAAGWGAFRYDLRDPSAAESRPKLSSMANETFGGIGFSYIADFVGKQCSALQPPRRQLCLIKVVSGLFEGRRSDGSVIRRGGAGEVIVGRIEPGTVYESSDDCVRINVWLNELRAVALLEQLLGHEVNAPLQFVAPDCWSSGAALSLSHAVDYIAAELAEPASLFAQGVGVPLFEELLFLQVLHGVPHNYSEALLDAREASPSRTTRRAEAFIRANLQRALTVEEIASASGVSVRSLLNAFRRDHATTVVGFLRDLRLDASRADLRAGSGRVVAVARRYDFSNVGRFTAYYRKRFGESPAETLGKPR